MIHASVKTLIHWLWGIGVILTGLLALAAWRLASGPVPLDMVAEYLQSKPLGTEEDPFLLRIERAALVWEELADGPLLELTSADILTPADELIAHIPSLKVRLSATALLRGRIAGSEVFMQDAAFIATRRPDGSWNMGVTLGSATGEDGEDAGRLLAALFAELSRNDRDAPAGAYLDAISIRNARLTLHDPVENRTLMAPDASFFFFRHTNGIRFSADMMLGPDREDGEVRASGTFETDLARFDAKLRFSDLAAAPLAAMARVANDLEGLDLHDLHLSGEADTRFSVKDGSLALDNAEGHLSGNSVTLPESWTGGHRLPITRFELAGRVADGGDRLQVTLLDIETPSPVARNTPVTVSLTAQAHNMLTAPAIELEARITPLSVAELLGVWPQDWKPNTNSWISANLSDGHVRGTVARAMLTGPSLEALDLEDLDVTAQLDGMTARYLRGMPKVKNVSGILSITKPEVVIEVLGGRIPDPITTEGVEVVDGLIRMYDLDQKLHLANLDFNLRGDLSEVLRVLDSERFQYATRMGIDPDSVAGHTTALLSINMPLLKDLTFDDISLNVEGAITDALGAGVVAGRDLTDGELAVILNAHGMDVTGTARISGVRSGIVWRENFSGGDFRSRYRVKADVSAADLARLTGTTLDPDMVQGTSRVELMHTAARDRQDGARMVVNADLTSTDLALPLLSWRKKDGLPARLSFVADFPQEGPATLSDIDFQSSTGDRLAGAVTFDAENRWRDVRATDFVLGRTAGAVTLSRQPASAQGMATEGDPIPVRVAFDGSSLDLSSLMGGALSSGAEDTSGPPGTPMDINVRAGSAYLSANAPLTRLTGEITHDGSRVTSLTADARLSSGAPVDLSLTPDNGLSALRLHTVDAGRLLNTAGITDAVVGGQLDILGDMGGDGTFQGTAFLSRFIIRNTGVTDRLLDEARSSGTDERASAIPDDAMIGIEEMELPFSLNRGIVSISGARAHGGNLGFTAEGTYDVGGKALNVRGTLIPAYGMNQALSGIPLLGTVLTGGKGQGIFAATYTIRGDGERTQIQVNPVAALAPGILRNVFTPFEPKKVKAQPAEPTLEDPASDTAGDKAGAPAPQAAPDASQP